MGRKLTLTFASTECQVSGDEPMSAAGALLSGGVEQIGRLGANRLGPGGCSCASARVHT